jgi:hypothetical protein
MIIFPCQREESEERSGVSAGTLLVQEILSFSVDIVYATPAISSAAPPSPTPRPTPRAKAVVSAGGAWVAKTQEYVELLTEQSAGNAVN